MVSPSSSAEHAPTDTPSCPWQRWVEARTRLRVNSFITSSSKSRISTIRWSMASSSSGSSPSHRSSGISAVRIALRWLEDLQQDAVGIAQVDAVAAGVDAGVDQHGRADERVHAGVDQPLVHVD